MPKMVDVAGCVKSCGQAHSCSCSRGTLDGIPPLSEKPKPDALEEAVVPTYGHSGGTRRAELG